jgi:hypothetical protein
MAAELQDFKTITVLNGAENRGNASPMDWKSRLQRFFVRLLPFTIPAFRRRISAISASIDRRPAVAGRVVDNPVDTKRVIAKT